MFKTITNKHHSYFLFVLTIFLHVYDEIYLPPISLLLPTTPSTACTQFHLFLFLSNNPLSPVGNAHLYMVVGPSPGARETCQWPNSQRRMTVPAQVALNTNSFSVRGGSWRAPPPTWPCAGNFSCGGFLSATGTERAALKLFPAFLPFSGSYGVPA